MIRKLLLMVLLLSVFGVAGYPPGALFSPNPAWAADPVGPPPDDPPKPIPQTFLDLRGTWTGTFKSARANGYTNGEITVKITKFTPPFLYRGWIIVTINGQDQPPEVLTATISPEGVFRTSGSLKVRTATLQYLPATNLKKFPSGYQPALVGTSQHVDTDTNATQTISFIWRKTTR